MELLSIIEEGRQIWTANKPLRKPEDFEGITFRVMSSPFLITAYRLCGAYVITVPYGDIYFNLEIGRIHAETQPFFAVQEMKFYEVQDYMIKADQLPFIGTFAANYALIERLPKKVRDLIAEAIEGANAYIKDDIMSKKILFTLEEYQQRIKKTKEAMDKHGMELLLVMDPANINYLMDGTNLVNWIRSKKSSAEIEYMRQAARVCEIAMQTAIDEIDVGVWEKDVAAKVCAAQISDTDTFGGSSPAIFPIMPSAERTSTAHLTFDPDRKYQADDVVLLELAGARHRYHAPLSRTVY